MGITKGFGTFLCPRGWGVCCFLLHQFCPWGGGLVRFWHSWTSEDWGEWVASMCFLIPKGGFKMDDIKVLCWFIFFPIKLRAQELFIIVLKSIKSKDWWYVSCVDFQWIFQWFLLVRSRAPIKFMFNIPTHYQLNCLLFSWALGLDIRLARTHMAK